jgi:hypothetical protein
VFPRQPLSIKPLQHALHPSHQHRYLHTLTQKGLTHSATNRHSHKQALTQTGTHTKMVELLRQLVGSRQILL